jgi:hypothetical protein
MSESRQDEQEGFLTRWSRRKTLSRQGEELPEPAEDVRGEPREAAAEARQPSAASEEVSSQQASEEAGLPEEAPELPPLESLDENSDYSAFLGDGVPADLKQKALRKLFHGPKFNVRDGLDDYDWDFSNPEPLGDIITAEMRYRVERELERLAGLDEDEEHEEDTTSVAAVDAAKHEEHDEGNNEVDAEADDDRSEPS